MNTPINLKIKPLSIRNVTNKLPADTQYKIAYAKAEASMIKEGAILRQYCSNYHFYIELYEFDLKRELALDFEILCHQLFVVFVIEGAVSYNNDIGENLTDASKGICFATITVDGQYSAYLDSGKHVILYMAPRHDWLLRNGKFPKIVKFIQEAEHTGQAVAFMNKTVLNRQLYSALVRLWLVELDNEEDPENTLLYLFKQVLNGYHDAQEAGNYLPNLAPAEKLAEICQYVDDNFLREDIMDLVKLSQRFYTSPRTIRRLFKKEKDTTVRIYVENKRLQHAKKILLETNEPINSIAYLCGYHSPTYFARMFRKKFFCSPKGVRIGK